MAKTKECEVCGTRTRKARRVAVLLDLDGSTRPRRIGECCMGRALILVTMPPAVVVAKLAAIELAAEMVGKKTKRGRKADPGLVARIETGVGELAAAAVRRREARRVGTQELAPAGAACPDPAPSAGRLLATRARKESRRLAREAVAEVAADRAEFDELAAAESHAARKRRRETKPCALCKGKGRYPSKAKGNPEIPCEAAGCVDGRVPA